MSAIRVPSDRPVIVWKCGCGRTGRASSIVSALDRGNDHIADRCEHYIIKVSAEPKVPMCQHRWCLICRWYAWRKSVADAKLLAENVAHYVAHGYFK